VNWTYIWNCNSNNWPWTWTFIRYCTISTKFSQGLTGHLTSGFARFWYQIPQVKLFLQWLKPLGGGELKANDEDVTSIQYDMWNVLNEPNVTNSVIDLEDGSNSNRSRLFLAFVSMFVFFPTFFQTLTITKECTSLATSCERVVINDWPGEPRAHHLPPHFFQGPAQPHVKHRCQGPTLAVLASSSRSTPSKNPPGSSMRSCQRSP